MLTERLDESDARETVAVACTVAAVVLAKIYWISRIGFDDPLMPVLEALGLSLFLIATPVWLTRALAGNSWWKSQSVITLGCMALSVIAGMAAGVTGSSSVIAFAITGYALALLTLVQWLRRGPVLKSIAFIVGASVFTGWCAGVIWGSRYKMPLFWETLTVRANIHHDTFYYGAIANMMDTYGVPSTGLDGIPVIHYHFGSPWMFAQWSHLLRVDVLSFYSLGYPVIVLPLFFSAVLLLAVEARRVFGSVTEVPLRSDWRVWLVFLAATVGFIPTVALDALAVWNSNAFISESYLIGMPVFFLLLGAAVAFWKGNVWGETGRGSVSAAIFLIVLLPVMLAVSGFLKISLMLLPLGVGCWLFIRLALYRRPLAVASLVLSFIAVGLTYRLISLPEQNGGISPLHFMRFDAAEGWQQFFPLVHLLWSGVYAGMRMWEEGVSDLRGLGDALRRRTMIDVEILFAVAVLGFLPGEIVSIHGGSAVYFSDVQRWLALAFIVARLPLWVAKWRAREIMPRERTPGAGSVRLSTLLAIFVALPFVITLFVNLAQWPVRVLRANVTLRRELIGQSGAQLAGFRQLTDQAVLTAGEKKSAYYPIVTALREIALLPKEERRHALLFIPQSNTQYWSMFVDDGRCEFTPLIAPAISSVAMLDGMPAASCRETEQYNMPLYHPRTGPQMPDAVSDEALCRKARAKGFKEVIALEAPDEVSLRRRRLDCYLD
jgi:hypothetical protein